MFNLAVKKNFEKNLPLKVYGNLKNSVFKLYNSILIFIFQLSQSSCGFPAIIFPHVTLQANGQTNASL